MTASEQPCQADEASDTESSRQLTGPEYEGLVAGLVRRLVQDSRLAGCEIDAGRTSLVPGASGYTHQIDLSLRDRARGRLFIVEAKCWKDVVGVDAVLTLAARKADIEAAEPAVQVCASIVSTKRVTKGAATLARHFGIKTDTVRDEAEFGLSFADQHFLGMVERLSATDEMSAVLMRFCSGCGIQFTVEVNESRCPVCLAIS